VRVSVCFDISNIYIQMLTRARLTRASYIVVYMDEGKEKRGGMCCSHMKHTHTGSDAESGDAAAHNMHMCGGEKAKDINL
jgi:hypothetical protein